MYSTKDIYLCAALMALGAKYEKVDRSDPKHQVFYLSSDEKIEGIFAGVDKGKVLTTKLNFENIEKQYVNKTLEVNVWEFKEAIQRVKSIIHNG